MIENSDPNKQTKLYQEFKFWFTFFKKREKQAEEFEENLKEIGVISTAEEFWGIYQHMRRPSNLHRGCEFFLFKKDIKPMWEHEANQNGGRFIISLKKIPANNKIWEDILISFIMTDKTEDHLNGVVMNVRNQEYHISVWTKNLSPELQNKTLQWVKSNIECPSDSTIEYKKHPTKDEIKEMQITNSKDNDDRVKTGTETNIAFTNSLREQAEPDKNGET